MRLVISLIMVAVSIGLLSIYGADVAVGYASEAGDGQGFLPFDHKTRGMGFGLPALVLPFVAYFISKKEPSKLLGALIIVSAILVIVGGVAVIINAGDDDNIDNTADDMMEGDAADTDDGAFNGDRNGQMKYDSIALIVIGAIQIWLGTRQIRSASVYTS